MNSDQNVITVAFGIVGGLGKYLLQVQSTPFLLNVVGAIITACLCGAASVAGKEGYLWIKVRLKRLKLRRGTKRQNTGGDSPVV